jgi:hypothetical protein
MPWRWGESDRDALPEIELRCLSRGAQRPLVRLEQFAQSERGQNLRASTTLSSAAIGIASEAISSHESSPITATKPP